jgi:ankyrin repeat protein
MGTDPNYIDPLGGPILKYTIKNGNIELLRYLLDRGADPGSEDSDGNSIHHLGLASEFPEI